MEKHMYEFESIKSMAKRLDGTGGGAQALAVLSCISLIRETRGTLDTVNAASAIVHLADALVGRERGADLIIQTASYITNKINK